MDQEAITRVEATHGPSITWRNGQVSWVCTCGAGWPCRVWQLADDVRQQRARMARDTRRYTL
jgi:hypothetical protein